MRSLFALTCFLFLALLSAPPLTGESAKKNDNPDKFLLSKEAREILETAETMEFYSLDPEMQLKEGGFHRWKVLGKVEMKTPEAKKRLAKVVVDANEASDGRGAKCFDPRHGVRVVKGEKTVDFVICFACSWIYVYGLGEDRIVFHVSRDKQEAFDAILKEAKVPLPKGAKD